MRGTPSLIFALFLVSTATIGVPGTAFAQTPHKCMVNGAMVIQDSPCRVARPAKPVTPASGQPVTPASGQLVAPSPVSQGASAAQSDLARQKAFVAKAAKDRQVSDLQYEIARSEKNINSLRATLAEELAALERQKSGANNNLAGATYLNSLANERQAVTARYEVDINTQRDRLKQLREDLARAQGG